MTPGRRQAKAWLPMSTLAMEPVADNDTMASRSELGYWGATSATQAAGSKGSGASS